MSTTMIGIGGASVSKTPGDVIKTMALGSCVSVITYLPAQRISGMIHIALPDSQVNVDKAKDLPCYFADTGLTLLLKKLKQISSHGIGNMIIKLAGGAQVMDASGFFNIGKRNILSVKKNLWKYSLGAISEDIGGSISRTVWTEVDSGKVFISSPGKGEWEI